MESLRRLESMSSRTPISTSRMRATRLQIRRRAPLAGLVPPAFVATVGAVLLNWGGSTIRGALGSAAMLTAAPTAMLGGVPVKGGTGLYLIVALTSALVWMLVGFWAGARATRSTDAEWPDFWRAFSWMAIPLAGGVLVAYAMVQKVLL